MTGERLFFNIEKKAFFFQEWVDILLYKFFVKWGSFSFVNKCHMFLNELSVQLEKGWEGVLT